MIIYLLKSGLSLLLIYLVYRLVLEREKMPIFNRIYLLIGLAFSFVVPLISLKFGNTSFSSNQVLGTLHFAEPGIARTASMAHESIFHVEDLVLAIYLLITSVFFFRFLFRLSSIFKKIKQNEKVAYEGVHLVLLDQQILPYTFWKFIFVSRKSYTEKEIESELFDHEMAHVSQLHTIDILIIEGFKVIFWFNPLLRVYKKAMQMNHEYLADHEVIKNDQKTQYYQHLLLNKAKSNTELHLSSNFNYLVTKKRIRMMTKNTSRTKSLVLSSMVVPFFTLLLLTFGNNMQAQKAPESTGNSEVEKMKDAYFQNSIIEYKQAEGPSIFKPYNELTLKEKSIIPPPPSYEAGGEKTRVVPLPKGAVVSIDKNGKVVVDKAGKRIPPPPPAPPASPTKTKDVKKGDRKSAERKAPQVKE